MVGTSATVSALARSRERHMRNGAIARITCGCARFVDADFGLSDMVQVNP
jgi:hypothetical protein